MTPERAGELAVRGAGLVVVVSVAVALAGLTWRLTDWSDGRASVTVAQSAPPRAAGVDPDVAIIVALAPFGGGSGAAGLPLSSLGLVLKGVLLAWPAETSVALISTGEGPAQAYGVGATPAGNAVIEAIEIDRVILKVGDRRELLAFPQPLAGAAPAPNPTPGAGITITPATPPAGPQAAALAPVAPAAGPAAQAGDATAAAQPASIPGPASMGVTATAQGYRIGANPAPELRRFGLRPGDVIETLNGQSVGDVAGDRQLLERAVASGGARVEVVREGRRITLTIPLR